MGSREINYRLYHIIFVKRGETELQHEYFSSRGPRNAVKRFRKFYPYETYEMREISNVLSFQDKKEGE